ncbi:hypothetical protein HanIR_Chr09g0422401 [Helianthus annuus]|nr:hypothetical protein HanIR_Chr09g0422401 [Helianthus annuus]
MLARIEVVAGERMGGSQLAWPYRPTSGLKAKPQKATPKPKPTQDGGLGVFSQPKPHTPCP